MTAIKIIAKPFVFCFSAPAKGLFFELNNNIKNCAHILVEQNFSLSTTSNTLSPGTVRAFRGTLLSRSP